MYNEFKISLQNKLAREMANEQFSWKSVFKALELLGLDM